MAIRDTFEGPAGLTSRVPKEYVERQGKFGKVVETKLSDDHTFDRPDDADAHTAEDFGKGCPEVDLEERIRG